MKKMIKNFLTGLKTSWLYRLGLVIGLLIPLSIYIGAFEAEYIKDTWYNTVISYTHAILMVSLVAFFLFIITVAIVNWIREW